MSKIRPYLVILIPKLTKNTKNTRSYSTSYHVFTHLCCVIIAHGEVLPRSLVFCVSVIPYSNGLKRCIRQNIRTKSRKLETLKSTGIRVIS